MARVDLRPIAKSPEAMLGYLDTNFRRIKDTLESLTNAEFGHLEVTTAIEINTGMPEVYEAFAGLRGAPTSNGCFVRAYPVGDNSPSNIIVEVYDSSFNLSTTPVEVTWYAVGE